MGPVPHHVRVPPAAAARRRVTTRHPDGGALMPELAAGSRLRDYRLLADFTVGAGGNCRYALAERKGERYFVKQFLSPKYPLDTSPGTPEGRARRRAAFAAFERYQTEKLAA